jgi:hypothetical protein
VAREGEGWGGFDGGKRVRHSFSWPINFLVNCFFMVVLSLAR